jgi:transketolase
MRKLFAELLYDKMKVDKRVFLLTGDLGYGLFDKIRNDFSSDRYINCGVGEQAMIGCAAGLAAAGKIPFCYSITPFLIYRPFEFIRNLVNNDRANVKLIGGGRGRDYGNQGVTHWCDDDKLIFTNIFTNIQSYWPEDKQEVRGLFNRMIAEYRPFYVNLKR